MLKVNTDNEYKAVERVYSGSTEIDKILDKNGNVLFAVNKEVEGTPALTYKGKEETNLKNYRIYGNTVNGENVGDRTANLFDKSGSQYGNNLHWVPTFRLVYSDAYYGSPIMDVTGLNTITRSYTGTGANYFSTSDLSQFVNVSNIGTVDTGVTVNVPDGYTKYVFNIPNTISPDSIMVNAGSTPLPYEPYGYKVPVTVTNGTDTQTTNLYLPEQIKMVGDEAEYVDYKEQKQHRVRKNLFPVVAISKTVNGVTFTVNADKSVTCNGTNNGTSGAVFEFNPSGVSLEIGESYIVTGCPEGGAIGRSYVIQYNNGSSWSYEIGTGATFTALGTGIARPRIIISTGVTVNNLTFYPMIRKANIEDDTYEPYIEDTELDVTLPALPTLSGTNTLSVGTEVQPSNVYLKGRIKEII